MSSRQPDAPDDLGEKRDPEFIRRWLGHLAWMVDEYHHTTVDGLEHVPRGAALAVGNHNGGIMSPDMFALMVAWWRRFGTDEPAYGLMHDLPFHVPVLGDALARCGAVRARPANAVALLERGARVLVYPGGDLDAFRPASRRNEVVFGERTGFVRIALRTGVPIVPVVSVGAHDAFHVLDDGRALVQRLGLKRFTRIEVMPVALALPFGLSVGPGPYLPVPVRMHLRVLPPIGWPSLPPEAADDRDVVWDCREQVRGAMQAALDELARDRELGRRRLRLFGR